MAKARVAVLRTKPETVLAHLRRIEGASGPAIAEATGWAAHTVRGFLAGLAKKGIRVEVLDRVRPVGSGKEGAKCSYTVYRIPEAARACAWATSPGRRCRRSIPAGVPASDSGSSWRGLWG